MFNYMLATNFDDMVKCAWKVEIGFLSYFSVSDCKLRSCYSWGGLFSNERFLAWAFNYALATHYIIFYSRGDDMIIGSLEGGDEFPQIY